MLGLGLGVALVLVLMALVVSKRSRERVFALMWSNGVRVFIHWSVRHARTSCVNAAGELRGRLLEVHLR